MLVVVVAVAVLGEPLDELRAGVGTSPELGRDSLLLEETRTEYELDWPLMRPGGATVVVVVGFQVVVSRGGAVVVVAIFGSLPPLPVGRLSP